MTRYNTGPESVGSIIGGFRQYSKQEMAERFCKADYNVRLNGDQIAVCKKCGGERMFHFTGYGKDCWFPIACECMLEAEAKESFAEEVKENRERSGLSVEDINITFETFPQNSENARAFTSAINFCENIDKVLERGQGIYIYGATGTGKTLLAKCITNFLLDDGRKVRFAEACDVLAPLGSAYSADSRNENAALIAECVAADVLILDNLGDDDFSSSKGATAAAAQRRLSKLIEGRYGKSTVFTSPRSIEMLAEECHVKIGTVDRIREMATRVFRFEGKSYRHPAAMSEIAF